MTGVDVLAEGIEVAADEEGLTSTPNRGQDLNIRSPADLNENSLKPGNQQVSIMEQMSPEDQLRRFLPSQVCHDYHLEEDSIKGAYGIVFFGKYKYGNGIPNSIALKTLIPNNPENITTDLENLKREFEKWLLLPPHFNVVGGRRFKTVQLFLPELTDDVETTQVLIPVMLMDRMDGSLRDWIGSDQFTEADRLAAIAQAFNGLYHLYNSGIEGHGDLKPENILYQDLQQKLAPNENIPKRLSPWLIKIADFGMSDAWIERNYFKGSWREYIAPERLGDETMQKFVPEKSDIFSMGIITAEILLRRHPARNLKKAKSSEGKWIRNAKNQDWELNEITSDKLRKLIIQCLSPEPNSRPTALNAMQICCEILKEEHSIDIEPTLRLWNNHEKISIVPYVSHYSEEIHRLSLITGLGEAAKSKARGRLYEILDKIEVMDYYSLGDWIDALEVLLDILKSDAANSAQKEIEGLESLAKQHFTKTLDSLDYDTFNKKKASIHEEDIRQPFEIFSHLIGRLASIAQIDFEQVYNRKWKITNIAIAGFAFHMATESHGGQKTKRGSIEYLNIAIELSPTEAAPCYFRALWKHMEQRLRKSSSKEDIQIKDALISDLKTACKLAPEWSEPKRLLLRLTVDKAE